jgi:hypothetical protein
MGVEKQIRIRPDPISFAKSDIFLLDPDLDPTNYHGIFEDIPTPTRYASTYRYSYACEAPARYIYVLYTSFTRCNLIYQVRRTKPRHQRGISTPTGYIYN